LPGFVRFDQRYVSVPIWSRQQTPRKQANTIRPLALLQLWLDNVAQDMKVLASGDRPVRIMEGSGLAQDIQPNRFPVITAQVMETASRSTSKAQKR
jgi:hypothetical protein